MSSIRNLSGAPSFGGKSSTLDIGGGRRRVRSHTADGGLNSSLTSRTFSQLGSFSNSSENNRPHRRSMYAAFHTGASQHHMAGEVIGPEQSFSYRPRISNDYTIRDASFRNSVAHPPNSSGSMSPTPSGPGRFRKLRSSTWDSAAGKLSPMARMGRSTSLDAPDNSPGSGASVGSVNSLTGSLQGGLGHRDSLGITSNFEFEDLQVEVSSSEGSSENYEETQHELGIHSSLLSVHEVIHEEENEVASPKEDESSIKDGVDISVASNQIEETKVISSTRSGIIRSSSDSTTKSVAKVTFADDVTVDDIERPERPSYCAKLPALTQWDEISGEGDESTVGSPPAASLVTGPSRKQSHFQRQNTPSVMQKLNPFGDLSWSLIGSCVARTAPCFWCSRKFGISSTDRQILLRLNLLCAFFCVIQICLGVFLFLLKSTGFVEDDGDESLEGEKDKPLVSLNLWSLGLFVFCLSVVNAVLLISAILAQRAIREVNLVGSVRFMWSLFWLLPIQIFFMFGLLDYYSVNEVHTKHWWDDPSMKASRKWFCVEGTAEGQCMVPIKGGAEYETEKDWCEANYNETNCEVIRDDAQSQYNLTSQIFYLSNFIWALILVVLMWITLNILQAIITLPIVQRSKESNIPLWLSLPITGCFAIGYLLNYSDTSSAEIRDMVLIGLFYILTGAAFLLAAFTGIFLKFYTVLNGRQRRFKQGVVIFFILTIVVTVFSIGTIFITSLLHSFSLVESSTDQQYKRIACDFDRGGSCTGCDQDDPDLICPEWSEEDVQKVLDSIMKQSATLAAIFLVYALITLRYGFVLFRHVSRYQIEYV